MKKCILLISLLLILVSILFSCVSTSSSSDTAVIEGKKYTLVFSDEFDGPFYWQNWGLSCLYYDPDFSRAKANDGSFPGSLIFGAEEPYDEIALVNSFGTWAMNTEIAYTENGVLHLKAVRQKYGDDWYVFMPSICSTKKYERGFVCEIRYKMPVKGNDMAYQMSLQPDDTETAELFLCNTLSAVKDKIRYNPGITITAENPSVSVSDLNTTACDMPDSEFYEWHTVSAVYDDDRFAVYHDGHKSYERKWDDSVSMEYPVRFLLNMGLAGNRSTLSNDIPWIGSFDETPGEYDMLIDYIRIYEIND